MKFKVVALFIGILMIAVGPAQACTLFAAAGEEWVQGGGVLVSKNRDWTPEVQEMRLVTGKGLKYYGLYSGKDGKLTIKGGVNEKGLAVFSATAGTIPKAEREKMPYYRGTLIGHLLSKYSTIDEALADRPVYLGPRFLIMADRTKAAYVEIGPEGRMAVKETANGVLYHTNHYVAEDMLWANEKPAGESSLARYERIGQLLSETAHPFTLDNFVTFSHDKNAGPDNSIWRDGKTAKSTQTLAAFIVYLPPEGAPAIYVKLRRNPEDRGREEVIQVSADDLFKD